MCYCDKRLGVQSHLGKDSGKGTRSLTKFLVDAKLKVKVVPDK